jgi:hypothetical protein
MLSSFQKSSCDGAKLLDLASGDGGDERGDGAGFGKPGRLDAGVQHGRGTPGVAEILERQERPADFFGGGVVLARAGFEQFSTEARSEHAGAGGEAVQFEIAQMNDGGALADAADDATGGHAAQQAREVRIVFRILTDDGVLDGLADFGVHQTADGVQSGFAIGAEISFVFDVNGERNAASFGDFTQAGFKTGGIARVGAWQHED